MGVILSNLTSFWAMWCENNLFPHQAQLASSLLDHTDMLHQNSVKEMLLLSIHWTSTWYCGGSAFWWEMSSLSPLVFLLLVHHAAYARWANTDCICIQHTLSWNLGGGILSAGSCQNLLNKKRQQGGFGPQQTWCSTWDWLQRQHTWWSVFFNCIPFL